MPQLSKEELKKLVRAQGSMPVVVGIALGIEAFKQGNVDQAKSFYANTIDIFDDADDDLLRDMYKALQQYFNAQFSDDDEEVKEE